MLLFAWTLFLVSTTALAGKAEVYSPLFGDAIRGYDPVAYFSEGRPLKGRSEYSLEYQGATWLFSSAANRQAFQQMPEKYAPRYGGYCAYAVANGDTASAEPDLWTIHNGKLYLNYNRRINQEFRSNIDAYIKQADTNWPLIEKKD